jgi:hypothetical protein
MLDLLFLLARVVLSKTGKQAHGSFVSAQLDMRLVRHTRSNLCVSRNAAGTVVANLGYTGILFAISHTY